MRPVVLIVFALILSLPFHAAFATRCGNAIVVEGDSSYRVRDKCGEPDSIERSVVYKTRAVHRGYRYVGSEDYSVVIEEWTYNLGPNRLIRLLRFENGVLKSIGNGGYGFNP